ncbi:hypothetical protein JYK22_02125, partial [Nonomuraea sp. RK-328]|nr:hypothetical protein [Nonomuraea sp. RK-328]
MKAQYFNATERTAALTEIWRQVLGNLDLDENSDLFEHGGTSLHVLQIVAEIYDVLGADVKLRQVFRNASPLSLSTSMELA